MSEKTTAERIAELRGWKWPAPHRLEYDLIFDTGGRGLTVGSKPFDPEHDWAQAGVLLVELPPTTELLHYQDPFGKDCWEVLMETPEPDPWIIESASTPQGAICRAWLAMKEAEHD